MGNCGDQKHQVARPGPSSPWRWISMDLDAPQTSICRLSRDPSCIRAHRSTSPRASPRPLWSSNLPPRHRPRHHYPQTIHCGTHTHPPRVPHTPVDTDAASTPLPALSATPPVVSRRERWMDATLLPSRTALHFLRRPQGLPCQRVLQRASKHHAAWDSTAGDAAVAGERDSSVT